MGFGEHAIWLYLGSKRQNRALASARCTFLDNKKVSYLVGKHEISDLPCKNQGVLSMVSGVLGILGGSFRSR